MMDDRDRLSGLAGAAYAIAAASSAEDRELRTIYLAVARSELARAAADVERHRAQLEAMEAEIRRVSAVRMEAGK